ncbi:MAG: Calx-beta domain-containing protein, partial [Flavobacteriaceae bacterium]
MAKFLPHVYFKHKSKKTTDYLRPINNAIKRTLQLSCFLLAALGMSQSGTIQFSSANYSVSESDGTVTLEIQRVGGSAGELTVQIQTADGTATIVDDYAGIPVPLTLIWADGNTTPKTVSLPIATDLLVEGNEEFSAFLTATNPDWLGTPSTATVTITDVPPGTIQFSSANYNVSESDGTVTLEIQRVGGSAGELTVQIQTADGTATIVDDYAGIPVPLTLVWTDGNTTPKTVSLPIATDLLVEGDEEFSAFLTATNPDWLGTPSTATVTISDVPPGAIQFSQANYNVSETAGTVTLEIQRVGGSIGMLQVAIQTMDGTATIVDDYAGIPVPLNLTWSDGDTTPKTVSLPIAPDLLVEGDEQFSAFLTATNPDWLGTPSTATVTISDVPPGTIQFSSANYSVSESDGTVTLEIQRVGGSAGTLQVAIQTMDGSATIVDDYAGIPVPLNLTWSDGDTTPKTVTLPIVDDIISEPNEDFSVFLTSTNPDWLGTPSSATVTILANDGGEICTTTVTTDAGMDQTVCGNTTVNLSATASGAGMWSGGSGSFADATMSATTYTPAPGELGTTVMLTWTTADPDGVGPCIEASDTVEITFDMEAYAGVNNQIVVCEGDIVDLGTLVSVPGGSFSGAGVGGSTFDTTGLAGGDYLITYSVNSGNSCPDDTALITVTVVDETIVQSCEVTDIDYCTPSEAPFYSFYWNEMKLVVPGSEFFSQNATHNLSFVEFADGTAIIQGATQSGNCSAELYIVLKERKNWTDWSAGGGGFKPQGCDPGALVKEDLRYYVVDGDKSTITTTGGDCLEEGTYKVTQRPDPDDLTTPNLGVHVGPGGALFDSDTTAEGLAGWAWMGPVGDERRWKIDFNFHISCKDNSQCGTEEVCDGIDNDLDGEIDEGFDADNDGIPDCEDVEECDGLDNDGDGEIDEGFDADNDGTPDCEDVEECDGLDNDGDGEIDEGFDADNDGTPDCEDVCDGDDSADADGDGVPDACDICDGDDTADADGDGVPDACDICDGDDGVDSDGDGIPDACDICDGDDTADADGEGVPDACDIC